MKVNLRETTNLHFKTMTREMKGMKKSMTQMMILLMKYQKKKLEARSKQVTFCSFFMDLLDDILSEPATIKAPARARFQPKAKSRLKTGPSIAVPSAGVLASKEQPVTSAPVNSESNQLVQPTEILDKNLDASNKSSLTRSDVLIDGILSAEAEEVVGSVITGRSETSISKSHRDVDVSAETSVGFRLPEDVIGVSTSAANVPSERPTLDACTTQIEEEISGFPDVAVASTSPFRPCAAQTAHDLPLSSANQDLGNLKEAPVSDAGDFQIDMEQVDNEFACYEADDILSEPVAGSGKRAVKFQPKPKAQSSRKKDTVEVVSHVPDGSRAPSENQHLHGGGSIAAGEPDTVSDLSLGRLDGDFYIETATAQSDTVELEDIDSWMSPHLPKESGKHGKTNTTDASNFSHESLDTGPTPPGIEANESGYEFLDGINDGIQYNNSSSPAKAPDELAVNRNESTEDKEYVGEEPSKKKKPRKPKKVAPENDKPARKRKKQSKVPDESTEEPRKKFPHATRRKRSVDKSLLEAPEDELDFQRVPIRDLIILAEYRERQAKKDAPVVQPPSTNERTDDSLLEDPSYDYDDSLGSDQDTGSLDNPSIRRVLNDTRCFNYHTHGKRKKPIRWSKQDTELFYQGVRQFGTDLSLIAELFPERDRSNIKLKYKKEERQQPMRLHDALTSRAKDNSHFQLVIQKLQEQAAAKPEQNQSDEDNLIDPTGEEGPDEDTLHTHETAKSEQNEEGSAADQEPERAQVASPSNSGISEFDWDTCDYKASDEYL